MQGMIDSMTKKERADPDIIDISAGEASRPAAAIEPHEVKKFLDQFDQVRATDEEDGRDDHLAERMKMVTGMGQAGAFYARRREYAQEQGRHRPSQEPKERAEERKKKKKKKR